MKLHASEITGSLSIKGTITPDGSGSHDLGSATNPWKDIHVMSSSIHVYDATGPIAKLGAIRGKGFEFKDHAGALTRISGSAMKLTGNANVAGTLTFGSLTDGSITIADFKDEDDLSSNSATSLPTQQSVKAYVDSQVTAQDLDFQGDSGGALAIDLDSETLDIAGDGAGISTAGSGNQITISGDHDALTNFVAGEHFTQANITTTGTVAAGVWNTTFGAVPNALISGSFSAASASLETNKASKGFAIAMAVAL